MKKNLLRISMLLLLFLLSVAVVGCDNNEEEIVVDATYEIHTELQKNYLAGDYNYATLYAKGVEELSKPNAVTISWEVESENSVDKYTFYLSESDSFSDTREFETTTNKVELINLKINTVYYWYVGYQLNGVSNKTDTKTFMIDATTPRNLCIDGLTNVRDLGGYKIVDNKHSNQGLIYRSSRLNENETTTNLITEAGIKEMLEVLKIKSELDIRRTGENGDITTSPLGSSVNYFSVPMESGGNCILLNTAVIKDAFAILGNEDNYPVVIHCSIGTDRTGMLCFLINALLGVSEEDLYRDYMFSNFGNIGGSRSSSIIDKYLNLIKRSEGDSLAEQTYNYLLSIDVNETDLNNLIRIMTK